MPEFNELALPGGPVVGDTPIQPLAPNTPLKADRPGFFGSIYGGFKETFPLITYPHATYQYYQRLNAMYDEVPDNWTSLDNSDYYDFTPQKYWLDLADANSPREQQVIYKQIQEREAQQKYLSTGSGVGRFTGGIIGGFFPFAGYLGYAAKFQGATKTAGFINNAIKAFPGALSTSLVVSTGRYADKEIDSLEAWTYENLAGTGLGMAFAGITGALSAAKLNKRLEATKLIYPDLTYEIQGTPESGVTGYVVKGGVGADPSKITAAQQFINDGMAVMGETPLFNSAFKGSPIVRGMTSRWKAVREFTRDVLPSRGILRVAGEAGEEGFQSMQQIAEGYLSLGYNAERIVNVSWEKYAGFGEGIKAFAPGKSAFTAIKNKLDAGEKILNRAQFKIETSRALINNQKHAIPEVAQAAADIRTNLYEPLYKQAVALEILPPDLDPVTAVSYLNIIHDKVKMQANPGKATVKLDISEGAPVIQEPGMLPRIDITSETFSELVVTEDGWIPTVAKSMLESSKQINEILAPRLNLKNEIARNKEILAKAKEARRSYLKQIKNKGSDISGLDEIRQTIDKISELNKKIKQFDKDLQTKIANKEIDPILVEHWANLTPEELKFLDEMQSPIKAAKKEIKEAEVDLTKLGTMKSFEQIQKLSLESPFYLQEMVEKTMSDFEQHGRKTALRSLRRLRNDFVLKQRAIQEDINANISEKKPLQTEKAQNLEMQIREKIDPIYKDIESKQSDILQLKEKIQNLLSKKKKLTNEHSRDVIDDKLFKARLKRDILKDSITDLKEEIASHKETIRAEFEKTSIPEEALTSEAQLLSQYAKDNKKILSATRDVYKQLYKLLKNPEVKIDDVKDLYSKSIKIVNRIQKKVKSENKASQTESLRLLKKEKLERLNRAKIKLENAEESLLQKLYSNEISPNLFIQAENGARYLRKKNLTPKLRTPLKNTAEAVEVAEKIYNKILQENPDQVMAQMFSASGGGFSPNPLMRRMLMVPHNTLFDYTVNDISVLAHKYSNFMGKKLAFEQVAKRKGLTGAQLEESYALKLTDEFQKAKATLMQEPKSAKRDKKLDKLKDEFDNAKDFIRNSNEVYWGTYSTGKYNPKVAGGLAAFRNWVYATSLGALPLLQIAEAGNLIRAYGWGEFLNEGVFPLIRSTFKGEKLSYTRADAAHSALALSTTLGAHADGVWGSFGQYHPQGWLDKALYNTASKIHNYTGVNQINDVMQHLSGMLSQSKTLKALKTFKAGGKLSKAEIERLHILGLDKHKYTDRILNQLERHGIEIDYNGEKAYSSNYKDWTDFEAQQVMLNSIRQEVNTVVIQTNPFDVPFCFHDPVVKTLTTFMGYAYASQNTRLIPLIQRPDANRIMGETLNMVLAAWVNPVRQYISTGEADTSPKALIASAITNGAPGGLFLDLGNRINASIEIPFLREFRTDRFQGKGIGTLFGGAAGSLGDNIVSTINMFLTGEISEGQLKRAFKLIPFASGPWQHRFLANKFIESLGAPKRRQRGSGWFGQAETEFGNQLDEILGGD